MQKSKLASAEPLVGPKFTPLTSGQQRLWFINRLRGESSEYNVVYALRLEGPLNVTCLKRSLERIVERHEALRTSFTMKDGQPIQAIHPQVRTPILLEDHSGDLAVRDAA